jgi:hypothetical protein
MAARKKNRKQKPAWERAYKGHAYWLGKSKLGRVTLLGGRTVNPKGKYYWEAGGRAGFTDELEKAKAAVESAASAADKQMDLFR